MNSMKKKILVVDDDEALLNSVESVLEQENKEYDVITSASGAEAIELIRKESPEIVISAVDIDDVDGIDIMKEARKNSIPTIILTSRTDDETVGMIKTYYRPDFYMKKPLDSKELISNIKSIFRSREERIEGIPPDKIEAVLKAISDSIEQGITIIDRNMDIVWVNKALESRGFAFKNVMHHKCYQIFNNRDSVCYDCPTLKAFQNGEVTRIMQKGGDGHDYRITSIPIRGPEDNIIYVIEFAEDTTKLEKPITA